MKPVEEHVRPHSSSISLGTHSRHRLPELVPHRLAFFMLLTHLVLKSRSSPEIKVVRNLEPIRPVGIWVNVAAYGVDGRSTRARIVCRPAH